MTDEPQDATATPAPPAPPATGVAAVDRALAELDGVEERPVPERAAVFEQVHGDLRRALDPSDDEGDGEDDEDGGDERGSDVEGGPGGPGAGADDERSA